MKTASKKSASKSVVSESVSQPVTLAAVPSQDPSQDPGAPAPTGAVVPKPPADWKPTKIGRGKGARGKQGQVSNAALAGKELASSTTFAADFGPHAPSPARLAHLMAGAAAWRGHWVSSKRWGAYAAEQNASWWEAALEGASLLQPAFDYAVVRDPALAEKYPSTTQFMQAASAIAKRGATSRKAKAVASGKVPKGKGKAKGGTPVVAVATEAATPAAPPPAK